MTTGLAYSEAFLRNETGPRHPERADRLRASIVQLKASGTWDKLDVWEPGQADEATLELVHSQPFVAEIREFLARRGGHGGADTVASTGSWEAALRAVGGAVEAVERVSQGVLDNAFCLMRPPGHHATPD